MRQPAPKLIAIEAMEYHLGIMAELKIMPVQPGRILQEVFYHPARGAENRLVAATGRSKKQVGKVVRGKRGISADTLLCPERGPAINTTMDHSNLRRAA